MLIRCLLFLMFTIIIITGQSMNNIRVSDWYLTRYNQSSITVVFKTTVRSNIMCASSCVSTLSCDSFSFEKASNVCTGYTHLSSGIEVIVTDDMGYYVRHTEMASDPTATIDLEGQTTTQDSPKVTSEGTHSTVEEQSTTESHQTTTKAVQPTTTESATTDLIQQATTESQTTLELSQASTIGQTTPGSQSFETSGCMSDCTGYPDGFYQSCNGCNIYVTCSGGITYDYRDCPAPNMFWDETVKNCVFDSTTCS